MLLKIEECELVFDIIKHRFESDRLSEKLQFDETGNVPKLILEFFLFLKERGYTLRKYRSADGVNFRELSEFEDMKDDNYNVSLYVDEYSKCKIKNNNVCPMVTHYDYDGKVVFDLFLEHIAKEKPELIDENVNRLSFHIYINDYVLYFLKAIRYTLFFSKKNETYSLKDEIYNYKQKLNNNLLSFLKSTKRE